MRSRRRWMSRSKSRPSSRRVSRAWTSRRSWRPSRPDCRCPDSVPAFLALQKIAEGDARARGLFLHRDGLNAFLELDPELSLQLADEVVPRGHRAGFELGNDARPLVDLRPEVGLLPSAGFPRLADHLREV